MDDVEAVVEMLGGLTVGGLRAPPAKGIIQEDTRGTGRTKSGEEVAGRVAGEGDNASVDGEIATAISKRL